jgi:hypothetical protein
MAQPPRRVDLRLTIPATAPFDGVASELAGKFAEYAGAGAAAAARLRKDVDAAIAPFIAVGAAGAAPSIDLDLRARDGELVVTTQAGAKTTRTSCPLPD